ncbi:hypothetical protein PVAP13_8KG297501, partial [Panicum virgatum]
ILLAPAAAGGRRRLVDLPDPPLAPDGQPLPLGPDSGRLSSSQTWGVVLFFILVGLVVSFVMCLCDNKEEQVTGREGDDVESGKNATAAAAEAPLECTYRAAEGWEETSCSVCLADLADGEAVRVLQPCMHYFHPACVEEWLRNKATCPLCRAPAVAAAAAAKGGQRRRT